MINKLKFLILAIILVTLLVLLFKYRIGDVRPVILPPLNPATSAFPQATAGTGEAPDIPLVVPSGFSIGTFATQIPGARDLEFSPQATLLVSQTSRGAVVALPDKNRDGKTDEVRTVLTGLQKPHGLAFFKDKLLVAEETRVVRYLWNEQDLSAKFDRILLELPKGGNHFTRSLVIANDGKLYVSLGSTCNVCYEKHDWLAAVIVSDIEGNSPRVFAKGLRNAVFLQIHPQTQQLWATEMGRDFLGDNLPPDEINILQEGKNYGWPVCYGNRVHDSNFDKNQYFRDPCLDTEAPVYQIPAHSAPLGLTFVNSTQFPNDWQDDLLVAYHGSWNRSSPTGYKVVRLVVRQGEVVSATDFLTGFLKGVQTLGRPADVIFDKEGSLFVSDDKAGAVYKIISSRLGNPD